MIDTTYGNIPESEAERLAAACPNAQGNDYPAGATEPHITHLLGALLIASGHRTVLETGSFLGHTSEWLALILEKLGGGKLVCCEIDPERAAAVDARLFQLGLPSVEWEVRNEDALKVIASIPDQSLGFVFLDDDHQKPHVATEVEALLPKMVPNGIMAFHDVYGVCELSDVVEAFGGYCLEMPRNGPAGGLGLIQVR